MFVLFLTKIYIQVSWHGKKKPDDHNQYVLYNFSLTVKAATLIFTSGRGSSISSAKEEKSGFIYNLVKS